MKAMIFTQDPFHGLYVSTALAGIGLRSCLTTSYRPSFLALSVQISQVCVVESWSFENLRHSFKNYIDSQRRKGNDSPLLVVLADVASASMKSHFIESFSECVFFPTANIECLQVLNNKGSFTKLCSDIGVPTPKSKVTRSIEDVLSFKSTSSVVSKPLEMFGGIDVKMYDSVASCAKHLHRSKAAFPLLIQEFIDGRHFGLNVFSHCGDVKVHTIQKIISGRRHVAFVEHPSILGLGKRICRAVEYTGLANFDVIADTDGKIYFLECNPRPWTTMNYSLCAGVNFIQAGLSFAKGANMPSPYGQPRRDTPVVQSTVLPDVLSSQSPRMGSPYRNLPYRLDPFAYIALRALG